MRLIVNQVFVYGFLLAALIALALLVSVTPDPLFNLPGDARLWAFGFTISCGVVGWALGVDTMRQLGKSAYDE